MSISEDELARLEQDVRDYLPMTRKDALRLIEEYWEQAAQNRAEEEARRLAFSRFPAYEAERDALAQQLAPVREALIAAEDALEESDWGEETRGGNALRLVREALAGPALEAGARIEARLAAGDALAKSDDRLDEIAAKWRASCVRDYGGVNLSPLPLRRLMRMTLAEYERAKEGA